MTGRNDSNEEWRCEEDEEDCAESSETTHWDSDNISILSDDSVYPDYELEGNKNRVAADTIYQACAQNDTLALQERLQREVSPEDAMELDVNGRNGLMVACYKGFEDIVTDLSRCPFVNVNHQDNDGNTALMIAAQAGHVTIVNYLVNFYTGVDIEKRDIRGFTALMKAAMQGRNECMAALAMAGADINAVDHYRGKTAKEWALLTGRFETLRKLRRLLERPCAEQFCDRYVPEWPDLKSLVEKAMSVRSRGERITQKLRSAFTITFPQDPQDNGVLDHMVRMTTSLASPFICTACRPLCPSSPPAIGKKRLAVPEIYQMYPGRQAESVTVTHRSPSITFSSSCSNLNMDSRHRGSMISVTSSQGTRGFYPTRILRRNSVFPVGCIPEIKVTRSPEPTPKKEKKKKSKNKNFLEPPKWRYKELKEEKKKAKKEQEDKEGKSKKEKKKKK
ncbi:photoreceptor ankyrin repeat protein [Erpetoichthys calabaricus]|uniref:photoreceptor ankyrin repeat protein n=1 Tax=Erpetoichthys calabaricus TaxID=27687 RepID=UPI0022349359|nr:photoreceptor ankyrin repeat protein [Erpetoichthys calabaricus]